MFADFISSHKQRIQQGPWMWHQKLWLGCWVTCKTRFSSPAETNPTECMYAGFGCCIFSGSTQLLRKPVLAQDGLQSNIEHLVCSPPLKILDVTGNKLLNWLAGCLISKESSIDKQNSCINCSVAFVLSC